MIKHLLASGLFAGFTVALLATLLQFAFLERHILLAERYESGALAHFGAAASHNQDAIAPKPAAKDAQATGHHNPMDAEGPFWQRQIKTALTMLITYGGYGLVMVAGFAFANHFGHAVSVQTGVLWGVAGFASFALAPALGLEPELPGGQSAALEARQLWWIGCAVATAAGLAMLAYGHGLMPRLAGVVLLALPHLIGAPHLDTYSGVVPPELAASFAARSLGVGLVAWVTLGGLTAWAWDRKA